MTGSPHRRSNLQSLGATWAANPAPFLGQIVSNQFGYGQLIFAALGNATRDFTLGLAGLPPTFQTAFQAVLARRCWQTGCTWPQRVRRSRRPGSRATTVGVDACHGVAVLAISARRGRSATSHPVRTMLWE